MGTNRSFNYLLFLSIVIYSTAFAQPAIELAINSIESNKLLNAEEQKTVKESLNKKILPMFDPIKNDYVDEWHRGTVEYKPTEYTPIPEQGNRVYKKYANYSLHKTIIPDGTVIRGVNFSQKDPHTEAIEGKNLTFIECNLENVEIDPSWVLVDSYEHHSMKEIIEEGGKTFEIIYEEKNGQMVEVDRLDRTRIISEP